MSFSLTRSSSYSVNCVFGGSSTADLSFTYSYVTFPYFGCIYPWLYYIPTSNLCDNSCPSLQFPNADLVCVTCRYDCLTCYFPNKCYTCHSTRYLEYSNYSCLPLPGYYENRSNIAPTCDSPCATCHISASLCLSCDDDTLFLSNHTCINCSQLLEGCETCSTTSCYTCTSPYTLVSTNYCGLPCNDSYCSVCSNANTSLCYYCNSSDVYVN